MIHYHGCPITPRQTLYELAGRFFCNSFADARDVAVCHEIGQGNMLDNGAFSTWRGGRETDWRAWAEWVEPWLDYRTTWAVLPDSIDGGEEENDLLVREWGGVFGDQGAPVWHLDESIDRLVSLCSSFDRVCFGSAGAYSVVGSKLWHRRVAAAFDAIADVDGRVRIWVHMLRGLALAGSHYPFASADSTNAARNHKGSHRQKPRPIAEIVAEIDARQCPARWQRTGTQLEFAA